MTGARPSTATEAGPARRRRSSGIATTSVVAGLAALALLVGGCATAGQGSGPPTSPAATSATSPAGPPPAAGATTPAPATAPAAASPEVARVFPAATGPTCRPAGAQDQLTTSTGATPVDATVCDYSSVAPGALVVFARWADGAGAQSYYDDTENLGPRIEDFDVWQSSGVEQGPLYTAQSGGQVISTALYTGLPYSWEIRTATLDQSNAVFGQVRFRSRAELGQ